MENSEPFICTPNSKTPIRTLGMRRSLTRTIIKTFAPITYSPSIDGATQLIDVQSSPQIYSEDTCTRDNEFNENGIDKTPGNTPEPSINFETRIRRSRLSLNQRWKNEAISKKVRRLKCRRLLNEVESKNSEGSLLSAEHLSFTTCVRASNSLNVSALSQKNADLMSKIILWRNCCVQTLENLLEKSSCDNMESLLDALGIPSDLIRYDRSQQIFLDPD
ncbi:uncharacterized protein LOC129719186 [Wyeomyia smithii]|uniref:uncharacterized protein LOC129719186 n=1 Tax=Wyeomyia smithii TaxID=174621 RepID=UPI002467B7D4|nr:uncharacterized protein LOC129719186 [Wyeomyia smithii]